MFWQRQYDTLSECETENSDHHCLKLLTAQHNTTIHIVWSSFPRRYLQLYIGYGFRRKCTHTHIYMHKKSK